MRIRRINAIIEKELARMFKEPAYLFLITAVFGLSFGGFFTTEESYTVQVINNDAESPYPNWSENFISNLSKNEILHVELVNDEDTAQISLQNGDISAVLIIPDQFGEAIEVYFLNLANPENWINISIESHYDAGSLVVAQLLPPLFQQALMETMFGVGSTSVDLPFSFGEELVDARKISLFESILL